MRYVAFLRAINVGGHVVRMAALKKLFESTGLSGVETFIQSGNVVFDSRAGGPAIEARISKTLEAGLGYRVETFVRSLRELGTVLTDQPFDLKGGDAGSRLYVGFMHREPSADLQKSLLQYSTAEDSLRIKGREVYWLCRTRFSDSPLAGPVIEKTLKAPLTIRSVTTLSRIVAKYS